MKVPESLVVLSLLYLAAEASYGRNPPKVQLYSHTPGEYGKQNMLICHVSNFHPPDISIQLLREGGNLQGSFQTDLAFNTDWHFHLTRSGPFMPQRGEKFLCRVDHGGRTYNYEWAPNM